MYCIVQNTLNILSHTQLWYILGYRLRFYWSPFKPQSNRRLIWTIITKPVPDEGTRLKWQGILCLWERYYCHSFYQTKGAYVHINKNPGKDLDVAVEAATVIKYYDDPLWLAIPYKYLHNQLPETNDCIVQLCLSFGLIFFIFSIPSLEDLHNYGTP